MNETGQYYMRRWWENSFVPTYYKFMLIFYSLPFFPNRPTYTSYSAEGQEANLPRFTWSENFSPNTQLHGVLIHLLLKVLKDLLVRPQFKKRYCNRKDIWSQEWKNHKNKLSVHFLSKGGLSISFHSLTLEEKLV